IEIPHKNDLDLGKHLALRFTAEQLPDSYELIEGFLRHKGAYARFKRLLESEGVLTAWYAYEAEAGETALREWCAENGIEIIEDRDARG
ncbi:MAG: hypothetical protein ACRETT_01425, partial [Steroidobacteraceae bacterium]